MVTRHRNPALETEGSADAPARAATPTRAGRARVKRAAQAAVASPPMRRDRTTIDAKPLSHTRSSETAAAATGPPPAAAIAASAETRSGSTMDMAEPDAPSADPSDPACAMAHAAAMEPEAVATAAAASRGTEAPACADVGGRSDETAAAANWAGSDSASPEPAEPAWVTAARAHTGSEVTTLRAPLRDSTAPRKPASSSSSASSPLAPPAPPLSPPPSAAAPPPPAAAAPAAAATSAPIPRPSAACRVAAGSRSASRSARINDSETAPANDDAAAGRAADSAERPARAAVSVAAFTAGAAASSSAGSAADTASAAARINTGGAEHRHAGWSAPQSAVSTDWVRNAVSRAVSGARADSTKASLTAARDAHAASALLMVSHVGAVSPERTLERESSASCCSHETPPTRASSASD